MIKSRHITQQVQSKEAAKKIIQKDKRLFKTYGITLVEWLNMLEDQGRVCKLCLKVPLSGRFNVDHRHVQKYKKLSLEEKKKEVRGLLCFTCNVLIGKLEKRNNARFVLEQLVVYFNEYKLKGDN